ncbi:hypothetical protein H4R18_001547 [Coemansia javaensis]|uniref:Metaxin n=1 Tax=Coemansia javaensis TaxID=2761396 RepID=A0A9W8HDF7_9FUNG|nr:hypothetical protein H4R18_001547 [Coemansia javaensis]
MYSLHSWGSPLAAEGLASFDPSCLSVQAYLQLCGAEWQLCPASSAEISPSRCLPALVCEDSVVESGFWRIVQFLKSEGHDLDAGLDADQAAQAIAYISMVRDGLADALLFSWYLVPENFVDAIRPRLARLFGFPLGMVIPTQLKTHAEQRLGAGCTVAADPKPADPDGAAQSRLPRIYLLAKDGFRQHADRSAHPIYKQADRYLAVLSQKLGTKQYFFGDRPSALDAVVYGHLAPVLRLDLPQDTLRAAVVGRYPNLASHCERIHARLEWPAPAAGPSLVASMCAAVRQSVLRRLGGPVLLSAQQSPGNDPKRAEKVRSVVGALFVFFGYVIYNGIVSAPAPVERLSAPDVGDVLSAVRDM